MLKKIIALVSICAFIIALTACSGSSRPTGNEKISPGESMTADEWNNYRDSLTGGK